MSMKNNGRYKINIKIDDFQYASFQEVLQKDSVIFKGTELHNTNIVPVHGKISISATFKTPTVVTFTASLIDNNLNKIHDLTLTLDNKLTSSFSEGESFVIKKYINEDLVTGNLKDLQTFINWKTYTGSNEIETQVDSLQCATAKHIFLTAGYLEQSFVATGRVSVFDMFENRVLEGSELEHKISNFMPFQASLNKFENSVLDLVLTGATRVPLPVDSNLEVIKNCSVTQNLLSGYAYDDGMVVLGDFYNL